MHGKVDEGNMVVTSIREFDDQYWEEKMVNNDGL